MHLLALVDLCKLAFDFIKSGSNEDKYKTFAENTSQTPEFIKTIVEVLLKFLIDSVKFSWTETQFQSLVLDGLTVEQVCVLSQFVQIKKETIENLLKQDQKSDLRFRQLEWRLEAR